jgi:KUP system potassium uptake protein
MRADNEGEGGIMALITLMRRWAGQGSRTAMTLAALGIFGAALFFGDSMITPAISVLSAVEGLKVVEPRLEGWIVPITAVTPGTEPWQKHHASGNAGQRQAQSRAS